MVSVDEKVLFIVTYSFPPLGKAGASIRVVKFIKYLSQAGWLFNILTADRSRLGSSNPQAETAHILLNDIPTNTSVYHTRAWEVPTRWFGSLRYHLADPNRGMSSRVSNIDKRRLSLSSLIFPDTNIPWAMTSVPLGIKAIWQTKADIIYAVAPPITALVIGWLLSIITGKPLIVDYKDDRIDVGKYQEFPALIQKLHQLLERIIVQRAEYVISVTPSSLRGFQERHPEEDLDKFVFLPNGADLEEYTSAYRDGVVESIGDQPKFIIVNGGGYAPNYRDASTFLQAIGLVVSRRPDLLSIIRIRFIGEGAFQFYGEILAELGIDSIFEEVPTMRREDFVKTLCSADMLLLIQTLGYPTSIAGTFYEYWAAGSAPIMIVGEPGDMWDMLNANELGVAVAHTDAESMAVALEKLVDAKLAGQPKRILQEGIEQYDRKRLAERLDRLLRQAIQS